MIASLAWKATFAKLNAETHWKSWDAFALAPPVQQRQILSERMLETIRYFGGRPDAYPEWAELAQGSSADDVWNHWSSLPIVTKKDIQERFDPEEIRARYGVDGSINTSGGSTGTPTRFIWDRDAQRLRSVLQYYCWQKLGWRPGLPVMSLWGSPRDLGQGEAPRTQLLRKIRGVTIIDGYKFDERTVEEVRQTLDGHRRLAVYGYTTLLEQLAREFLAGGYKVQSGKVVTAWSGAEPLHDYQSELFREVFGKPIHNQYGGREFGAIAYKLAGSSSFELFRPVVFVEIVNDKNELCAPGEVGRVLLTTLNGRGTPFIRYENGDLAKYSDADISEAGLVGMTSVEGRMTSLIHLPDGRTFHSVFWHQLFKDYKEIQAFHIHQTAQGALDISYVGAPLGPDTNGKLRLLIGNMLGSVPFTITQVEALPKTAQGKHLQVTSDFSPGR